MESLNITQLNKDAAPGPKRNESGVSYLEKRALLEARLLQRVTRSPSSTTFNTAVPHPLSSTQESIWFLDRLEPGSPLYNIPEALRLRGPLNIAALTKSLETVVSRHGALRTQFQSCEGKPMQVVRDACALTLPVVDLTTHPLAMRMEEAQKQIQTEAIKAFDLNQDLLLRAKLLKLAEEDHILILTMHHIVSDLWSFLVLHRELEILYPAFCSGSGSSLPELLIQFSQISGREPERLQESASKKQFAYWKEKLQGELPTLQWPTDKSRSTTQTFRGERRYLRYPASLLENLKILSRQEGATLYTTLLAGFAALLQRYTSQSELIVGSPVSGRNSTQAEKLIGYFVNTLPIRVSVQNAGNFPQLLTQVRETVLGAFGNQEVPMEKIIEELQIPRAGRNPLFQTVFQFLPVPPPTLKLPGMSCDLLDIDTGTAKFDLTVTLFENSNELQGHFEFNSDLFDDAFVERMIGHFQTLLEGLVGHPEKAIDSHPILTASEKQQILVDWNNTTTNFPRHATIHQLFEEQARKTPNAVALVYEDSQLSYGELNERADQLAQHLSQLGVTPGSLVGFCVERSLEMIVGLLGILKAGGAYVTIDPAYPRERLEFMFEDTQASVFVTTRKFAALASASAKVVCLDENLQQLNNLSTLPSTASASSDHPAYVIYTSGSTGNPKGVVVPHRGVVRLVKQTNYFQFNANEVFLQFAPISFDASTLEIFGPLLNGGKLVVFPKDFESLEQLGNIIRRHQVTTLWLTSGLFSQMIEHHIDHLKNVRWLFAGGDVLSVPHVLKALRELPNTQLINGYGPTENTTFTTCYPIPKDWDGKRSVPIGKPISQTQLYILDKTMQPVPIGIPGELFIGGEGLALEYLHTPELTTRKFVTNPFSQDAKAKLYRTGDLVRWLPDGNVEFLGRLDFQVKIRGFRVELGEIENTISQSPLIKSCVVVARVDKSATKQLVAYVVPQSEVQPGDLRQFLQQRLPSHMVPSQFVFLTEFPLNANGKVDRSRLPEPSEKAVSSDESNQPRNAAEKDIIQIWSEVLGKKEIGIHDNFFEIGGHSLLATRIISRISRQFNVELPLRTVFDAPTVASQAETIGRLRPQFPSESAPILRRRRTSISTPSNQPTVLQSS